MKRKLQLAIIFHLGKRYVIKESLTMIFEYIPQVLGILALSIYSVRRFKNGYDEKNFFNVATIWAVVALITFCFSIMSFVVLNIYFGVIYCAVFGVSIVVAMKFRNTEKQ